MWRLGVVKKRVKIVRNRFHNSIREKEFKKTSVSLWWAVTFKPFEIQTWDWSRMKENSKIFKITLSDKCYKNILNGFIKYKRYELFFQWLSLLSYAQNSSWLWQAVTSKRFKIQTWDWSRLKENSKIFKITSTEKSLNNFFCLFYQPMKRCVFFFDSRGINF